MLDDCGNGDSSSDLHYCGASQEENLTKLPQMPSQEMKW
jgi:hypothetical protein